MSVSEATCVVGISLSAGLWTALEVRIKGDDVYVNYLDRNGARQAHTSYHASGQRHTKKGRDYVLWTGGPSGRWEPMKQFLRPPAKVSGREQIGTIGWNVSDVPSVLPPATSPADMQVVIPDQSSPEIVTFETSVVGPEAAPRFDVLGFPVLQRHQFSNGIVTVEVEAIGLCYAGG